MVTYPLIGMFLCLGNVKAFQPPLSSCIGFHEVVYRIKFKLVLLHTVLFLLNNQLRQSIP